MSGTANDLRRLLCGTVAIPAFMLAGASVAIGALSKETQADGSLPPTAPLPLRIAQYLLGLGVVSSLATIGSWVAIGSDGNFKSSASFFGVTVSGLSNEMLGRMIFASALSPNSSRSRKSHWRSNRKHPPWKKPLPSPWSD